MKTFILGIKPSLKRRIVSPRVQRDTLVASVVFLVQLNQVRVTLQYKQATRSIS
ncbi:MAG: hypothetical protein V7K68_31245 [Nostoc sp.]|uniref:hypothetical protein n=1 Tax=Nostoc sp. TaxID=1180 RepID=UPI002FFBFB05